MKKPFIHVTTVIILMCAILFVTLETCLKNDKNHDSPTLQHVVYTLPHDPNSQKIRFVNTILPLVIKSNEKVAQERSRIIAIAEKKAKAGEQDKRIIDKLSRKYRVNVNDYKKRISELLTRVDMLPPSLVIAQAALESGWGTSRFSLEANNLFGIRTLSGRGIVPSERMDGIKISVFKDIQSCIDYHILNLNSHPQYMELRRMRQEMDPPYDPIVLAKGLKNYSEQGNAYVDKVVRIIRMNDLRKYDSLVNGIYCREDHKAHWFTLNYWKGS